MSLVKYILFNKKLYRLSGICVTLFFRSVSLFSASKFFVLYEVTFLLKCFNLSTKSVLSTKSSISALVVKFTCFKFSVVKLLNSCVVIYVLLWS